MTLNGISHLEVCYYIRNKMNLSISTKYEKDYILKVQRICVPRLRKKREWKTRKGVHLNVFL